MSKGYIDTSRITASQAQKLRSLVDVERINRDLNGIAENVVQRDVLRTAKDIEAIISERIKALRQENAFKEQQRQQAARVRRLVCLFALAAKVAKADGHVDATEVRVAERLFDKFGIKDSERQLYVNAFNDAIKSSDSIYSYAQTVARQFPVEIRLSLYELLWDVACADGVIVDSELSLLRQLCEYLGVGYDSYTTNFRRRASFYNQRRNDEKRDGWTSDERGRDSDNHREEPRGALAEAYVILGCVVSMTNDELKRMYRAAAKSYHPDVLRSKGIPDDLIAAANEKMIRLNEAWAMICKDRGI